MSSIVGIHPGSVSSSSPQVLGALQETAQDAGSIAIGEIGLDFFRGETNRDEQRTIFDAQLDLAIHLALPAVIHMRSAESDVLDVLTSRQRNPRLLFHSFDGTTRLRDYVLSTGSLIGVGGLMTKKRSVPLRDLLATIPAEHMVLETDTPFLIPTRARGRYNQPANIPIVASTLASILHLDLDEIAGVTTANVASFFTAWVP